MNYLHEAKQLSQAVHNLQGRVAWQSPSNIALIKYWGKHGQQLPDNASVSFTLSKSVTKTEVTYNQADNNENRLEFYFDNARKPEFEQRINKYIENILPYLPFLKDLKLVIRSSNSFPHSAGIASSASSMSALALCLVDIEKQIFENHSSQNTLLQKASFLARIGSGSACRSLFGYAAVWGTSPLVKGSVDTMAVPIEHNIDPVFKTFHDAILVVDATPKSVSSTAGHELMLEHYYRHGRKLQVADNMEKMMHALASGDLDSFIQVVESEALSLHALMMSSEPAFMLLKPNTINIIQRIKAFRETTKLPCAFTLDAGPNIHLLYPHHIKSQIVEFIEQELQPLCFDNVWIDDAVGLGPVCW